MDVQVAPAARSVFPPIHEKLWGPGACYTASMPLTLVDFHGKVL